MSADSLGQEIANGAAGGAVGVKFAPASSQVYGDDDRCLALYESALAHGLVVITQSGRAGVPGQRGDPYGRPEYFRPGLETFPDLRIVFAHFGEGFEHEVVDLARDYSGVYADLSMQLRRNLGDEGRQRLAGLIQAMGDDRVMFGTNYPLGNPATCLDRLLHLESVDLQQVSRETFARLYGASNA